MSHHLARTIRDALIVAPHPDDETIGAWGLMRLLERRGARVWVLVVSDGGGSHPGSTAWPRARLVRERRRETQRAMRTIGIPRQRIQFLGLPDGALDRVELKRPIDRALRRMPAPDLLVGPVDDDAHCDHRAVARALRRHDRAQLGYRVWPLGAGQVGRLRLPLDTQARASKRRAIRSYRTQCGRITDSGTGMTITSRHLAAFVRPAEYYQVFA